ncbi:hypothetical protein CDEST_15462 [Colletotrichum destructivum]|uniref:Uncharacterized protein n=1 Tax=Colletotrichum destructivum TaxID=34406 RepID=A0AAX4J4E4_9PEZI|nr:hypothetical protein CDEST_15462 [Colletotrichum destructivum]
MSIDLDKICFYQPPTPGVRQRAPKGTGQQSNSANPSITEEVAVKPTIGSYTHHGDASSSNKSAGLAPEVHRQSVGSVFTPRDTTCSRIGGDTIPIKTPVPMKEPTKLGVTGEGRASETSVTRSLIKAPTPTTSQPVTLAEASAGSLSKSCDGYEVEGNTASLQSTGDRAESTPETSLERHSKDAASTSGSNRLLRQAVHREAVFPLGWNVVGRSRLTKAIPKRSPNPSQLYPECLTL